MGPPSRRCATPTAPSGAPTATSTPTASSRRSSTSPTPSRGSRSSPPMLPRSDDLTSDLWSWVIGGHLKIDLRLSELTTDQNYLFYVPLLSPHFGSCKDPSWSREVLCLSRSVVKFSTAHSAISPKDRSNASLRVGTPKSKSDT